MSLREVHVAYGGVAAWTAGGSTSARGEVLAVIGPNGSGKSTLLRVIALLQMPTRGEVCVHGRRVDPAHALAERRRMAVVFQQPLLADATVARQRRPRPAVPRRGPRRARGARSALARSPRMDALGPRRARTLSGGEAQRVALARALVLEPEVLLLDEPFAAVDSRPGQSLVPELEAILRADRIRTVVVTHDRGEAQALADRVAVVLRGRLEQVDETARVSQAPVSEDVARFVGVETIVTGWVARDGEITLVEVAGRKFGSRPRRLAESWSGSPFVRRT